MRYKVTEREEKKKIYLDFMADLEVFTGNVNSLAKDAALSHQKDFLERNAHDVNHLYASCAQIQQCESADAKEISSIIQCIFEQPLATHKKQSVTILKAVKTFPEQKTPSESDLSHIMREYVKYPETTRSFIRELEILTEDLQEIVEAIA